MLRDMFKKTYTKIDMKYRGEKRNLPERQRRTRR